MPGASSFCAGCHESPAVDKTRGVVVSDGCAGTLYFDWRNFLNERDARLVEGRYSFGQQAGMSINAGIRADF